MSNRKEWIFTVQGMTCDHCARTIDNAMRRIPGVIETTTDSAAGSSRVIVDVGIDSGTPAEVIRDKGYEVVGQNACELGDNSSSKNDDKLDLLIIGAGSAGFAAAIKATELGASVAIVERGALGGTCVNVGCVPSKTLIRAAEAHHHAGHTAFAGIHTKNEPPDFRAVIQQKTELVAELQQAKYWDVLSAYPNIMLMKGEARFRADGAVAEGMKLACQTFNKDVAKLSCCAA